jgi:hypothetical protein
MLLVLLLSKDTISCHLWSRSLIVIGVNFLIRGTALNRTGILLLGWKTAIDSQQHFRITERNFEKKILKQ